MKISIFGKKHTGPGMRARVGVLNESTGCFLNISIHQNVMMQASNPDLKNRDQEILRVLKIIRMDAETGLKFKRCSLGLPALPVRVDSH